MSATPVLLLDDDDEFRGFVADELRTAGFLPAEATTVEEAEAMVLRGSVRFEALILDVSLPDGNGNDLCARLRTARHGMPILMLSGSDGEGDVVRGLEAGAHGYMAKPVRPAVLIAHLRSQLRLHRSSMDAVFTLGPWQFHPGRKLLRGTNGARIWLTEKEVDILRHLQHAGRPATKRALLSDVWGYNSTVSSHTLETHIYRLRQKIEIDPANARLLVTTEGGYRLTSPEESTNPIPDWQARQNFAKQVQNEARALGSNEAQIAG